MPKYYTVQAANMLLPQLTQLLQQVQALVRQKGMVDGRVAQVRNSIRSNGYHNPIEDPMVEQASGALNNALRDAFNQLDTWDIELKDIQTGLIDFRAMREGREMKRERRREAARGSSKFRPEQGRPRNHAARTGRP